MASRNSDWQRLRNFSPYLVIAVVTIAMALPAILSAPLLHQSFWIDWVWADQFTAEMRKGVVYPRWLPLSHGGLGSPVFYYYPPAAFYLTAIFGLFGLPTYSTIIAAFAVAIAASGVTMLHWLKGWCRHPLVGTLIFMTAPYHVLDFYARGALAETLGIAFIPLIALGIKRAVELNKHGMVVVAFAGLILTHLPLAVLAIVFLIAPYALYLAKRDLRILARLGLSFATGAALAGVYLVPALMFDRHRAAEHLWLLPYLRTEYWSLFNYRWSELGFFPFLIFASIGTIAFASLVIWAAGRSGWAVYAMLVCLVIAGFAPGFWSLPIIDQVQFPFRALPFAEFALATAVAALPRKAIALVAIAPALVVAALASRYRESAPPLSLLNLRHPDVLEYLPPGVSRPGWTTAWHFIVADHLPPFRSTKSGVTPFFYPSWRVTCSGREMTTSPDPSTGRLAPEGANCQRHIEVTTTERVGQAISLLGLMMLLWWSWRSPTRRRSRRRIDQPGEA